MSIKSRLAAYAGLAILLLAILFESERAGLFLIPPDIKTQMNIAMILLLVFLASLATVHILREDEDE